MTPPPPPPLVSCGATARTLTMIIPIESKPGAGLRLACPVNEELVCVCVCVCARVCVRVCVCGAASTVTSQTPLQYSNRPDPYALLVTVVILYIYIIYNIIYNIYIIIYYILHIIYYNRLALTRQKKQAKRCSASEMATSSCGRERERRREGERERGRERERERERAAHERALPLLSRAATSDGHQQPRRPAAGGATGRMVPGPAIIPATGGAAGRLAASPRTSPMIPRAVSPGLRLPLFDRWRIPRYSILCIIHSRVYIVQSIL